MKQTAIISTTFGGLIVGEFDKQAAVNEPSNPCLDSQKLRYFGPAIVAHHSVHFVGPVRNPEPTYTVTQRDFYRTRRGE